MDNRAEFLRYYQNELTYLRHAGREFARRYPKVAGRLELTEEGSADPHVERLMEAFAYLTARLSQRLDNEFFEISGGLLEAVQPSLTEIVPPMAVATFVPSAATAKLTSGYTIPRQSRLFAPVRSQGPEETPGRDGISCRFETVYPVELWPIAIVDAAFEREDEDSIVIRLRSEGAWEELSLARLRFHISGDPMLGGTLYDALAAGLAAIVLESDTGERAVLPRESLTWVGFAADEAILPNGVPENPAYRLLAEYIHFPRKFFFFDITGFERARPARELTVRLKLSQSPRRLPIDRETFRLFSTPIVNLFSRISEPVRVTHRGSEYRLVADFRHERTTEIHSIRQVSASPDPARPAETVEPFFAFRHSAADANQTSFWYARRRPVDRADMTGTDVWLSFHDLQFRHVDPTTPVLYAHTLCTNRELAVQVSPGAKLHLEQPAPVQSITCSSRPTAPLHPPTDGATYWRLISNLSLNHLTLGEGEDRLKALRQVIRLYNFDEKPSVQRQAAGLCEMGVRPVMARIGPDAWRGFVPGSEVTLLLDETEFAGSSAVLFASVLRQFLALYAGVNSFVEVALRSRQREREWMRWGPLTGWNQTL
jgi:type VI secretion system protein ImpG